MLEDARPSVASPASRVEEELLALDGAAFDLLAYLVCSHHGKVRLSWHCSPADQEAQDDQLRILGIRDGDELPPVPMCVAGGTAVVPGVVLDLSAAAAGLNPRTGRSWTERVLDLVSARGPFTLAWLEALLRAADRRASRLDDPDELLAKESTP
jgi:CRISPR-associated endonuclease/helicase Cas3